MATPKASIDIALDVPGGICSITSQPLDVQKIVQSVGNNAAGATAVFIGTTRNSFKGRTVTRLEYQAYSKLAIKTIASIIQDARQSLTRSEHQPETQSSLIHCAVHHRIGVVPVGEPSIVIAVSSPHRKEAFVACERILEEVKQKAQIWKKEYYEGMNDSEAEWKANT
ncbi:Molybdopterin biosynthesis MoaE [Armillaria novae-zelandiae]|uniref:Molybdopterin biosynthesis MoaE n=1 Tax=Armillaria novae-zelandiae TaxID=153914 RepID=A0AA39UDG4_9AGAR|nr:Molybdopterin biosynthesis MoaE [Armillaria novae-zelandiae]